MEIGGYRLKTGADGSAVFNGVSLNLAKAKDGIIMILDSLGNQILVTQNEAKVWIVVVKGENAGKSVEKSIIVEAIK